MKFHYWKDGSTTITLANAKQCFGIFWRYGTRGLGAFRYFDNGGVWYRLVIFRWHLVVDL